MHNHRATVAAYYDAKRPSYTRKYNQGYFTHIHTGIYPPRRWPMLYTDADLMSLGLDRVRYLLFAGQENTTRLVCEGVATGSLRRVLDCGCGHAGTAIFLSQNHAPESITGITLSAEQHKQATQYIAQADQKHRIKVQIQDVFELPEVTDTPFSAMYGLESFCQIGRMPRLFQALQEVLEPGAAVSISDYFTTSAHAQIKPRFDEYWRSDVSTLAETLDAALSHGFRLQLVEDYTLRQVPFWRLSVAYSRLMLQHTQVLENKAESARLQESEEFHGELAEAFEGGQLLYYRLLLTR